MRVAVLLELDVSQLAIADRLGVPLPAVKRAVAQLRQVAPALEREERDWAE